MPPGGMEATVETVGPIMRSGDPVVTEAGPSSRKGRRIAFTVSSAIFAAAAAGGLYGIGLVIGWFDNELGGIHRVHDLGSGVLYGVILTVAFVAMTWRPEWKTSAFFQVVATAVAVLIAGLVSGEGGYVVFGLLVMAVAGILLALHPARTEVLRPALRPSPVMGALALAGSVPLVWFGLTMARLETGLSTDPHEGHWATMAAMAFGLVLTGLLASSRMRGWRLTAWCAGLGAAVYGLASIVFHRFPGTDVPYPGSEGFGWGLAALIGGLVFVAVAEWESRRPQRVG